MSHYNPSDPARNPQFRRNWDGRPAAVKLLGELGERDLERLLLQRGEAILNQLPAALTGELTRGEREDLARALGRPWLRRLRERRRPPGG